MDLHMTYSGVLDVWRESPSDPVQWALCCEPVPDGIKLVDGHLLIREWDLITIWDYDGEVLYQHTIRPDIRTDWTPLPRQNGIVAKWLERRWASLSLQRQDIAMRFVVGMPRISGHWTAWTQRGMEQEIWLHFFGLLGDKPPYRARILRPLPSIEA